MSKFNEEIQKNVSISLKTLEISGYKTFNDI